MRFNNVDKRRIFALNDNEEINGPVLYWMSRDQRADDNWGLLLAQEVALNTESELHVCFCLQEDSGLHAGFEVQGLRETAARLQELNIPLHLLVGSPGEKISQWISSKQIGLAIADFDPLRNNQEWKKDVKKHLSIPFWEVDSHNIVPARLASDQKEAGACTFRPKINNLLEEYLIEFMPMVNHPYNKFEVENIRKFDSVTESLSGLKSGNAEYAFKPGTEEALHTLILFLENRLSGYADGHFDPGNDVLSNLSPYLHFGQISAQRVALAVNKIDTDSDSRKAFLEELIVRKELSENFCLYEKNYYNIKGAADWARDSLLFHAKDQRDYSYSLTDFEKGETHSPLWNAAQKQMLQTGKMHGYLRIYWAKKILEWTAHPDLALEIAIELNDKYSLDGRDPNGYSGIMNAVCGVHDQAEEERAVYGNIRYLSSREFAKQFDIEAYIARWNI